MAAGDFYVGHWGLTILDYALSSPKVFGRVTTLNREFYSLCDGVSDSVWQGFHHARRPALKFLGAKVEADIGSDVPWKRRLQLCVEGAQRIARCYAPQQRRTTALLMTASLPAPVLPPRRRGVPPGPAPVPVQRFPQRRALLSEIRGSERTLREVVP